MKTLSILFFYLFLVSSPLTGHASELQEAHEGQEEKNKLFGGLLDRFKKEDDEKQEASEKTSEQAQTSLPMPTRPRPFNIEYKVSLGALPTGLKAEAKLRKQGEHYLFELYARNWILSYFEKSAFIWNELEPCDLITESYQFTFEGFGHTDAFEVYIDRDEAMAHSRTQRGDFDYEVPGNVSDALAYLFKLQCDVSQNKLNPDYRIAYDDGVDHYLFKYRGKETLRTPLGKLDTIVLERVYSSDNNETTYWIAPELDYLMVRMKHKQGRMVTATLKIKSVDFDIEDNEDPEEDE